LGLVFQNYALWPHMTVYKNMAFALEIQKMPKEEMDKRIRQSLAEVQMEGYENRYPREMSGGQQQRIALARMLAYRPGVFLMDEPLSNLDARLRMDMRAELKHLHYVAGATTVYVTHDQVEALTMSTEIAIMKEGVIQQKDTPANVYHVPANLFVADFIGNPKVNLLDGEVTKKDTVTVGDFDIPIKTNGASGKVVVAVRPEDVVITTDPASDGVGFLTYSVLPSGSDSTIVVRRGKTEITVKEQGISQIRQDEAVKLQFMSEKLNLYEKESGNLIAAG